MSSAILTAICMNYRLFAFSSGHFPLIQRGGYASGVKMQTPDSTMNSKEFHFRNMQ